MATHSQWAFTTAAYISDYISDSKVQQSNTYNFSPTVT